MTPSVQVIALAVEVAQRVSDDLRDGHLLQPAGSVAGVEVVFDAIGVKLFEALGFAVLQGARKLGSGLK